MFLALETPFPKLPSLSNSSCNGLVIPHIVLQIQSDSKTCWFRYGPVPLGVHLHISTLAFYVLILISETRLTYLVSKFLAGVGVGRGTSLFLPGMRRCSDSNTFGRIILEEDRIQKGQETS